MASGLQEVGQAIIKLVYDDKDLVQQGDKVGLTLGAKLKTAGVAAAAAAGTAIVETTKKLGELANRSAEAYGEFEQLAGGMEKIFDEVDQTVILQDAQNAWQDLNLSAREYMNNITGVGATFAQTMGDKKGYETARTGMKAIADFASATGRNVDELMGKYQLISRTAGSYLSIADQFAGILPQTTSDFLKQAQAAGILSKDYKKLTEVPVAEYQEAITKMIEKGVGDMGLLGNTADETAKTLTGSLAGAKSAIDNLITGFADPNADIATLANTAITAIGNYAENFATIFERALDGILEFISEHAGGLITKIAQFLGRVFPKLVQAGIKALGSLSQYLPEITQILIDLLDDVITSVADVLPSILRQITDGILGVIKVLTQPENMMKMVQAGITLLLALVEAIPEIIEALAEAFPTIIENIINWMTNPDNLMQIIEACMVIVGAIIAALPRIAKALFEGYKKIFTNIFQRLEGPATNAAEKVGGFFQGVAEKIGNFFKGIGEAIASFFEGLANKVKEIAQAIINFFQPVIDFFKNVGIVIIAIAATIGEGIYNTVIKPVVEWATAVGAKISEIATGVANWINEHVIQPISQAISAAFNWIGEKFRAFGEWAKNTATGIGNGIKNAFAAAGNWINDHFIKPVGSFFSKLWDGIKQGAKGLGEAIKNIIGTIAGWIKAPINAIIGGINGVIDKINGIKVPDWVPGLGGAHANFGHIPALAEGGITTGPTSALIGEKGREAVIPLEQNTGNWAGLLAGKLAEEFESQGNAPGSTINVYFNNQIDSKLDIEEINQELLTAIRRAA